MVKMKEKILPKEQVSKFIDEIRKDNKVFAPVRESGFYAFREIKSADEMSLDFRNTKIPPKEIFFPRTEILFSYKKTENGIEIIETEAPSATQIIFGIRPCDAKSFLLLDKFFAYGKFDDPYYQRRREKTLLIGMACTEPLSTCFCTSLGGSPFGEEGLDILLTDLGENYLVRSLNAKGAALLEKMPWLKEAVERDVFNATELTKKALAAIKQEFPVESIPKKLDDLFDNEEFWQKFSQQCIGCGSCSFMCPTCHCFDVTDEQTIDGGDRIRLWDTCQFPIFTKHGSGHNPRTISTQRIRHRMMHKFNYYPKTLYEIGCVGCGRCIIVCPANQDVRLLFEAIQEC